MRSNDVRDMLLPSVTASKTVTASPKEALEKAVIELPNRANARKDKALARFVSLQRDTLPTKFESPCTHTPDSPTEIPEETERQLPNRAKLATDIEDPNAL